MVPHWKYFTDKEIQLISNFFNLVPYKILCLLLTQKNPLRHPYQVSRIVPTKSNSLVLNPKLKLFDNIKVLSRLKLGLILTHTKIEYSTKCCALF